MGIALVVNLPWIISARRILSEIFAVTEGDALISSRFNRTAAMREEAMRRGEFGFFSCSFIIRAPSFIVGLRPPTLKTGTARGRLAFEYLCGAIAKSRPAAGTTDNHGMLRRQV
jgi:hypothetical protein